MLSSILVAATIILCLATGVSSQHAASPDWSTQCAARVHDWWQSNAPSNSSLNASVAERAASPPHVFIGANSEPDPNLNLDTAWGITYGFCQQTCGNITSFAFVNFSSQATNWVLPWFALIAQLPYETPTPFQDVMSALLAVGSPMLITYSLALSMLMKRRIRSDFAHVIQSAERASLGTVRPKILKRLEYARTIAEETLQAPMRICENMNWFSSLVTLDENHFWWVIAHDRLKALRRGITISLIMQILIAILTWVFTVITAAQNVGDLAISNAIASSMLWTWLVPIVAGWVAVGSQFRHDTINEALHTISSRQLLQKLDQSTDTVLSRTEGFQEGILKTAHASEYSSAQHHPYASTTRLLNSEDVQGEAPADSAVDATSSAFEMVDLHNKSDSHPPHIPLTRLPWAMESIPRCLSMRLTGAEESEGPVNNYARAFTHMTFYQTLIIAFNTLISHVQTHPSPEHPPPDAPAHAEQAVVSRVLAGYARRTPSGHEYLWTNIASPYKPFSMLPSTLKQDMTVALLLAGFLQFGTGGSAIFIGYHNVPVGVGCRTASFLLYVFLASVSFMSLFASSLLSHQAMLRHQGRRRVGVALSLAVVLTRFLGCAVGAGNAIWLVLSSVLELAGFYDTWSVVPILARVWPYV